MFPMKRGELSHFIKSKSTEGDGRTYIKNQPAALGSHDNPKLQSIIQDSSQMPMKFLSAIQCAMSLFSAYTVWNMLRTQDADITWM